MAHQEVIQVNVNIILRRPGRYDIDIPQLRNALWVAHPLPAANPGTAFVATGVGAAGSADAPAVPTPPLAPAVNAPAPVAAPTFSPAFAAHAFDHTSTSTRSASNPTFVTLPFAAGTQATPPTPSTLAAAAAPELAAPVPTPFFAAPAFLSGALPGAAAGAAPPITTAAFFITGPPSIDGVPPSNAPRTPPPSPERARVRSPALPAEAASDSVMDNDIVAFRPLTPAPRARGRRAILSPPPMPAIDAVPRPPPMSPFGGANAIVREDAVEALAL
ncbi:hypothetical protein FA95DRAFT_1577865 [Auriscalpium vulgare]|uniref:Uncharacterized protein n=1 Tax=Auriscalpium vulgare TaxID=40419 RepID=A0ACB8R4H0_9AGAM|nr:hypothetical protein FA95DRAFT_1577865 [Auriscalpium vulgare]